MTKIKNPTEPIENYLYLEGGLLHWKQSRFKSKVGKPVKTFYSTGGYALVKVCGRLLYQHRVVWYLCYGHWPKTLDHIDADKTNNNIENLREATDSQNLANRQPFKDKKYSDFKGVSKYRNKWKACCQGLHIGTFGSAELAAKAYDKQATLVWGEFAKTNFNLEHFDDE